MLVVSGLTYLDDDLKRWKQWRTPAVIILPKLPEPVQGGASTLPSTLTSGYRTHHCPSVARAPWYCWRCWCSCTGPSCGYSNVGKGEWGAGQGRDFWQAQFSPTPRCFYSHITNNLIYGWCALPSVRMMTLTYWKGGFIQNKNLVWKSVVGFETHFNITLDNGKQQDLLASI